MANLPFCLLKVKFLAPVSLTSFHPAHDDTLWPCLLIGLECSRSDLSTPLLLLPPCSDVPPLQQSRQNDAFKKIDYLILVCSTFPSRLMQSQCQRSHHGFGVTYNHPWALWPHLLLPFLLLLRRFSNGGCLALLSMNCWRHRWSCFSALAILPQTSTCDCPPPPTPIKCQAFVWLSPSRWSLLSCPGRRVNAASRPVFPLPSLVGSALILPHCFLCAVALVTF